MGEKDCEKLMNLIQDVIFEWEGGRMTSRESLKSIKKITMKRKIE